MRDSAIIYETFYKAVQKLPVEERAEAYDAYCRYSMYGEEYTGESITITCLLEMVSDKIKQANENYNRKVEGARKAREQKINADTRNNQVDNSLIPVDIKSNQDDSNTVTDTVTDTVIKPIKERVERKFAPPTLEEVKAYIREKGLNVDANKFYNYFTEGQWIDSKGTKVRNWKQKLLTWDSKTDKTQKPPNKFHNFDSREDSAYSEEATMKGFDELFSEVV